MHIFYLFASPKTTRFQRRLWWFSLGLITLLLYFSLSALISPASGAQKHGCAPDVPPPVAQPTPLQPLPSNVLINEVLSQPKSNWNCSEPSGVFSQEKDSWIEFYNPQNQAVDLYAAHAQISLNGGSTSALLPFGSAIAAHGLLVIFPQEHLTMASTSPWNIVLSVEGITVDQVAIPLLQPDQSYARVPDGTTTWLYAGNPTIDASNNAAAQPVTSTPTKTPKTTGTVTGNSTTSPPANASTQPTNAGTQPAWRQVQLPLTPTLTPDLTTTANSSAQASDQPQQAPIQQSNSPNGWLVALIVFFLLLLLAVLIWCWRLFHTP